MYNIPKFELVGDKLKDKNEQRKFIARMIHTKEWAGDPTVTRASEQDGYSYEEYYYEDWGVKDVWECEDHKRYLGKADWVLSRCKNFESAVELMQCFM